MSPRSLVIITSYPTRANGIIVLVNFAADFYFHNFTKRKFLNWAHYFPYDVKLRILAHSLSFLANQKARNAIFGAENLLISDIPQFYVPGNIRSRNVFRPIARERKSLMDYKV